MKPLKPKINYLVALIAIIALLFLYFAFFNSSLNVYEDPVGSGILIENKSSHTVRNIEVFIKANGQETLIKKIPELMPKKVYTLMLPETTESEITLIVKAEFQPAITKTVNVNELMKRTITVKIFGPNTADVGKSFDVELELCNSGNKTEEISVEEEHSLEFFERAFIQKHYFLSPISCSHLFFEFTPKRKGETEIIFNVKGPNIIRKLENKLVVS